MSNISRFIGNERGDGNYQENDGCPTEVAVLKRFWREMQAARSQDEEVSDLVEFLDNENVPCEDNLKLALSIAGRVKQYVGCKTEELREQVERLTEESVVLRASSRSKLETISSLELQVEKLTKERDAEIARNRPLQSLIKLTEETKSFLLKKSEENKEAVKQLDSERQANALLTEELAALAEQNEKLKEVTNLIYSWANNWDSEFMNDPDWLE